MIGFVLSVALQTAVINGSFRVQQRDDAITDQHSAYAVIGDRDQSVAIGCDRIGDQRLRAEVRLPSYVGTAQPGIVAGGLDVWYRVDEKPAIAERWAGNGRSIAAESVGNSPVSLALALRDGRRVFFRAYSPLQERVELDVRYDGAQATIGRVLELCGYLPNGKKAKKSK
jgi:hypothetical protein